MDAFTAELKIIGINPYVSVPDAIRDALFAAAGKDRGAIPIRGTVNGQPYRQTFVKYAGEWRLYINMKMLRNSPQRIGELLEVTVAFDPESRAIEIPPAFAEALSAHPDAKAIFDGLSPSRRHEIVRYLAHLKSETALERNIPLAIAFLQCNGRFAGRDKP